MLAGAGPSEKSKLHAPTRLRREAFAELPVNQSLFLVADPRIDVSILGELEIAFYQQFLKNF